MRLLIMTRIPPDVGGSAYSGIELADALHSAGIAVTCIAPHYIDQGPPSQSLAPVITLPVAHTRDAHRFAWVSGDSFTDLVLDTCRDWRPDLIVSNAIGFAGVALRAHSALRIPFAVIIRGQPSWDLAGGVHGPLMDEAALCLSKARLIVCVSEWLRSVLLETLGLPSVVIKNAPLLPTHQLPPSFPERPHDLIFVGRLVARKKPGDIITFLNHINDDALTCSIVGDGPLRDTLARCTTNTRVRLCGPLSRPDVFAELRAHKLLVISSEFEGDPRVLHEAAIVGTPSLVREAPWSLEFVPPPLRYIHPHHAIQRIRRLLRPEVWQLASARAIRLEHTNAARNLAAEYLARFEDALTRTSQRP